MKLILSLSCLLFVMTANAHTTIEAAGCENPVIGGHVFVQTWDLGDGISFERYSEGVTDQRQNDKFTMQTPEGAVALRSQYLPSLPNLTAVARQERYVMLATQEHRLTHLMSFDLKTGEKYRHRSIEGKVTSIIPLPGSLVLLVINNPEATIHGPAGNYLELIDTNINTVHHRLTLNTPNGMTTPELLVQTWDGVLVISEMNGSRRVGNWTIAEFPGAKYSPKFQLKLFKPGT